MNKITVRLDTVYGNQVCYPVCETAKLLCKLAGQKTFTHNTITIVRELGYEFEVIRNAAKDLDL